MDIFWISVILDAIYLSLWRLRDNGIYKSYLYFTIIALSLYLSYFFEMNQDHTYGGDDDFYSSMMEEVFNSDYDYSLTDFFNGRYSSFVYLISLLTYPFRLIGLHFDAPIKLALIYSALGSLLVPIYSKIYENIFKEEHNMWSILLFTPIVYYSIINREVLNYLAFGIYLYILSANKSKINEIVAMTGIFTFMYFVRPETAIAIPILFSLSKMRSLKSIMYMSLGVLLILMISQYFTTYYLKSFEQGRAIYFNQDLNASGLGTTLKYSANPVLKIANFFYTFISPIPPYYFAVRTTEFFYLMIGHIFWYFIVLFYALNYKRIFLSINSNTITLSFVLLSIYVGVVAYLGGTNRHYYTFIPALLLPMEYINKKYRYVTHNTLRTFMVILPLTSSIYIILKYLR
jgi:hypothetical protein